VGNDEARFFETPGQLAHLRWLRHVDRCGNGGFPALHMPVARSLPAKKEFRPEGTARSAKPLKQGVSHV
jgi:hypothetical protein